jgi:hypothetical protein
MTEKDGTTMPDSGRSEEQVQVRVYRFRGVLPSLAGLLLLLPLLLVFASLAAVLVAGGLFAAVVLPLFLRWRLPRPARDPREIELTPNQYTHVDPERRERGDPY